MYTSDSLESILSHLSVGVMDVIADGVNFRHLYFLLEFLAAWEKQPACLTPMAYKWCSAFSEVTELGPPSRFEPRFKPQAGILVHPVAKLLFSFVGPGIDPVCMGDASNHDHERTRSRAEHYPEMLPVVLEVGFRLVMPGPNQPALCLDHTPRHDLVFKRAFSSDDDEVVADAVCTWIADSHHMPDGSCVHCLAKHVEKDTPFSPWLRQMGIRLIERMWRSNLRVLELETIRLLNCLDVNVDDMEDIGTWAGLLVDVICSPAGHNGLSIHYWHLLGGLAWAWYFPTAHAMEVVRSLEGAENWEKLEVWMVVMWQHNPSGHLERFKQGTLKLLQQRPSTLPRFESFSRPWRVWNEPLLKDICAQARAEQSPLEPLPL